MVVKSFRSKSRIISAYGRFGFVRVIRKTATCRQQEYLYNQQLRRHFHTDVVNIKVDGKYYPTDSWTNLPGNIINSVPSRLHIQPDHPISITRSIIESHFSSPTFAHYNSLSPIVSTFQNFDSLGFPPDHPGRSKSDTYYINSSTVLRTHTSAHQVEIFRANNSPGYLISADVYRRDAIDRSHYPIFHQMEGARTWDRHKCSNGDLAFVVQRDIEKLPKLKNVMVTDTKNPLHSNRNPLQKEHGYEEASAIINHLKRNLECVMFEIFSRAKKVTSNTAPNPEFEVESLKMRWVEAYFPFTSPSWELEILWQDRWFEVLGCGVVQQSILKQADVPHQTGWAFGIGLERIAMLLFGIPDIRLFWSQDSRFLDQFKGLSLRLDEIKKFVPFSKYPGTHRDLSFWIQDISCPASCTIVQKIHENDIMQIVRDVAGDIVENVSKVDYFQHPKTGRVSWCYRVHYRSLEKTLSKIEVNTLHRDVEFALINKLGVEMR